MKAEDIRKRNEEIFKIVNTPCEMCAKVKEKHSCPYVSDIECNYDNEYCSCCEMCTDQCYGDI